jgi:hypothetical protein
MSELNDEKLRLQVNLADLSEENVRLEMQLSDTQKFAAQFDERKKVEWETKNEDIEQLKNVLKVFQCQHLDYERQMKCSSSEILKVCFFISL